MPASALSLLNTVSVYFSFLDEYLPENFLDIVVGGEDVQAAEAFAGRSKIRISNTWAGAPQETLYIGDSTVDAETAQNAGVDFAGVLNGMTTADELQSISAPVYYGEFSPVCYNES